ncbi:hypothetical protein H0E84_09770 [Luteimonas sp. SJ-92]|uniref:DUF2878 domain-containing protein n=1 Tax=Luteimonas salinisoli TaxID=2752307 RepID=A0A853JBQ4_9GAMM|nr:hypothetical protein [Luteimonas salinisoli]NZA26673.1 hypothetical protein [Luteimonas salinisoli]
MTSPLAAAPSFRHRPVLLCGIVAATLDLAVAIAFWAAEGMPAGRVLQAIAAWLLGPAAYSGGTATALFGVLLYTGLMCALAAGYRGLARRHGALLRRPLLGGALYGAAAYLAIFGLAVPVLTSAPAFVRPDWTLVCLLAYMFLIGVPCALFARLPGRHA